jgi:hypothetical protein
MRFAIDAWDPTYGSGTEAAALTPSEVPTNVDVEVPIGQWAPQAPAAATAAPPAVLFVDGVRRVEARAWITDAAGVVHLGIAASYGAGVVRCNSTASVISATVERRLFTTAADATDIVTRHGSFRAAAASGDGPDELSLALQQKMGELEVALAREALADEPGALLVVDGPLRQHGHLARTVGSIKTQHRSYGPPIVLETVGRLAAGERTPVFTVGDRFTRWSWYVRLPGVIAHPLAAVVRCEASCDLAVADVVALADQVTAVLPRFASAPHKDTRAPQNLYPIGGLERELRRRLGDQQLLIRALRLAAAEAA